jgi:hypothetical protein
MTIGVEWSDDPELPPINVDRSLGFEHAAIAAAHAYWRTLCRGRPMPVRADIDPVEMRRFLTHVALVHLPDDPSGEGEFSIRLAGDHVESVFGTISGRPLSKFLKPEIQKRWRTIFDLTVEEKAPLRFFGPVGFERKLWLDAELMLAPLAGPEGAVGMLFAGFAAWPNPTRKR